MRKTRIISAVLVAIVLLICMASLIVGTILVGVNERKTSLVKTGQSTEQKEETNPEGKNPAVIKRPKNFTEGIWIKKYAWEYACFKFETPEGMKIVCDPYEMYEKVAPDIVTESHQDGDHNDVSMLAGTYKLFPGPGEFEEKEVKGIKVAGIGGSHNKGDKGVTNTIFVFEINGIKIAHFASQGQVPNEEMWKKINSFKGIDILLIQGTRNPEYTGVKMTVDECFSVIDRLNPKIVIPEHGTANIGDDFAKHYNNTKADYIDLNGFVVTKNMLNGIKGHKIIDMDNTGPVD